MYFCIGHLGYCFIIHNTISYIQRVLKHLPMNVFLMLLRHRYLLLLRQPRGK